jgi:tetratricopeptide (TPR) repeat protein
MAQTVDDPLALAREAVSRKSWREAFEAYASLEQSSLGAVDLERYGEAAWWSGKLNEAVRLREGAYVAYAGEGEKVAAAQVALTLAWDEANRGAFAVSQGWFGTAERQLEGEEESAVHGRIALTQATQALFAEGNYPKALECLERAYELARRFGDRDTQMLALVAKGRTLVKMGEIDQGLELIDEGTAAAVSGELEAYSTTLVYCMTISTCQDLGDVRRAAEWTEAANRWCDRLDVTGFPGACRIHRAEIMRLRGDLEAAEKVATAACHELEDFERYITASGY